MNGLTATRSSTARARHGLCLCLFAVVSLAGCAVSPPVTDDMSVEVPRLPPKPELHPEIAETSPPTVEPAPEPGTGPVSPPAPTLSVAVLLTRRIPDYENVANALRAEIDSIDVYDLGDKSLTPAETIDRIRGSDVDVVVAVGHQAAQFAAALKDTPIVYSQVFNTESLELDPERVKGVSMLPPLDRQLAAWKELNPSLSSVGAIIGPGHEALLDEATRAGELHGVRFESRLARSDRETLYLFTRLVPQIDGYWLFPDNRILSPAVLRQMLNYAARHRVQIAVFNDSLLPLGATLSATTDHEDIARTILDVADRLHADEGADLPAVTPLNEIVISSGNALVQSIDAIPPAEGGR